MKMTVALCLCFAIMAAATAFGAEAALAKAKNSSTKNVTFILKNFTNPFCVATSDGAAKAAAENGINLTVKLPAEGDNNDQLLDLTREAIAEGRTDVFIMFPADSYKFVPAVQMAVEADIPVVMLAANIVHPEQIYETFVAADNRLVGRTIGEELARRMNYQGNVVLMEGVPGSTNSVARMGGAAEALAQYKDIKVVASVPGLGRKGVTYRQAGKDLMEKILDIAPQVDGMFTMVDELAIGAIEAMEAAGRFNDKVIVASCDGVKTGLESVKAGRMTFTCDISPYTQGYKAMDAAAKILKGETVPARIITDLLIIDRSNVDEFLK